MSTEYKLSKKQLEFYKTQGYLVCNDIFSSQEINNIVKWSLEIENFPETKGKWMKYYDQSLKEQSKNTLTRVENFFDYHKEFKSFFSTKKILNIISMLLESEPVLFKDKLNLKSPGGYGFDPHIDGHFLWKDKTNNLRKGWKHYASNFLNVVVPLDITNEVNGCLQVSDLAQTRKFLGSNWETISSKLISLTPKLKKKYRKKFTFKPISMKPGDLLLFNWKVCHFSKKNNSRNPRTIFYGTYAEIKNNKKNIRKQYYRDKIESKNPIQNKSLN